MLLNGFGECFFGKEDIHKDDTENKLNKQKTRHSDLSLEVQVSLSRDVHGAPDQTVSDEAVVHGYDEEWDDVEDEEGGGGVDFRVQLPGVGVGRAGDKRLVGVAGGEGVQVREDGFGNGQSHREQPDGPHSETDAESSAGPVNVQRFDDGFVPERRRDVCGA